MKQWQRNNRNINVETNEKRTVLRFLSRSIEIKQNRSEAIDASSTNNLTATATRTTKTHKILIILDFVLIFTFNLNQIQSLLTNQWYRFNGKCCKSQNAELNRLIWCPKNVDSFRLTRCVWKLSSENENDQKPMA